MQRPFKLFLLLLSAIVLALCVFFYFYKNSSSAPIKETLYKIKYRVPEVKLHYSGFIQPKKTTVLTMPVDGVILERYVQYGRTVKKNEGLFLISAKSFLREYKDALTAYVKAKSDYENAEIQLKEAVFLHQHELISEDEFKAKKQGFYSQQLSVIQSKETLSFFLKQLGMNAQPFYALSIANVDQLKQVLKLGEQQQNITIHAPENGILLSAAKSEEENKKLYKGDFVKQGDALALLADMNGVIVKIHVHESMINQLHVNDVVTVTGTAFPEQGLPGKIIEIDHQADMAMAGQPSFLVQVLVPLLGKTERAVIHAGMSAEVHITLRRQPQLMVPIQALQEHAGKMSLLVFDKKTGKKEQRFVEVGDTSVDSVVILKHVRAGEYIVVPS